MDPLLDQIAWLDGIGDFSLAIAGIPAFKLRSLVDQAMALDASALRNDTLPEKRYTLIAALLSRMRVRARDDLADMFIRRMGASVTTGRKQQRANAHITGKPSSCSAPPL